MFTKWLPCSSRHLILDKSITSRKKQGRRQNQFSSCAFLPFIQGANVSQEKLPRQAAIQLVHITTNGSLWSRIHPAWSVPMNISVKGSAYQPCLQKTFPYISLLGRDGPSLLKRIRKQIGFFSFYSGRRQGESVVRNDCHGSQWLYVQIKLNTVNKYYNTL